MKVPNILLSGNHQEIRSWRKNQMIIRTKKRRKDLLDNKSLKNFSEISKVENDKKKLLDSDEYINYPNW